MRVNEGIQVQEVAACFICGAKGLPIYSKMCDRLFNAPGVWSFLRCSQCGLVWLSPRPIPEDIGKIYANYYTHSCCTRLKPKLASMRKKIKHALLAAAFGYDSLLDRQGWRWIGKVLSSLPSLEERVGRRIMWVDWLSNGKLLDIGCGNGEFLSMMRDLGWEVLGTEPDIQAAKIVQDQFHVPVIVGTLEKANLPDNFFDVVTMNHVIEHVHDPIRLLRECWRILKPRGKLVVVTPNIESLGHRAFRESWGPLEPPRHLHLFSLQTVRACTEGADLRIETLRTTARGARWMWKASKLIRRDGRFSEGNINGRLRIESFIFQVVEGVICVLWPSSGEELVLIGVKGA